MIILKQPSEVLYRPITFNGVSTVAALHSVAVAAKGLVAGAEELGVVPQLFADAVTLAISGGTDGERYLITALADDADGGRAETELEVAVIDMAWSMPDGGVAYLTIAEFIDKFTLDEVLVMTDLGNGRIDRGLLIGALVDAQSIVDAHIAGRYTVPLTSVPAIVKMWLADLARARLYPRGAPDGVDAQAKAAIRMLERVQAGTMPLPGETAPTQAPSENPILIYPGRRAYPDGLAGY